MGLHMLTAAQMALVFAIEPQGQFQNIFMGCYHKCSLVMDLGSQKIKDRLGLSVALRLYLQLNFYFVPPLNT